MMDYSKDFGDFEGKVWLSCAHQGALPLTAVAEAHEAISWKIAPFKMTQERFDELPPRLKTALGQLIGCPPEDVILANSASYGLHLLANGFPWQAGDEVVVARNDFPSDILPWLGLEKRGVKIKFIEPRGFVVQPDELLQSISPRSRLFCTTWVNSFNGGRIDIEALGEICRAHDITFMLNCSQALGTRPLDVARLPVDAITSAGWKWLCGPYATGVCWMKPELRESLEYNQAYWLAMQTAADLKSAPRLEIKSDLGARKYDVFCTANFFNFKPWAAALEYLLACGISNIEAHDTNLIAQLITGLDLKKFRILSPPPENHGSMIVIISHIEPDLNHDIFNYLKHKGIEIAMRKGNLRIAPHLYNTVENIDYLLSALNAFVG